MASWVKEAVTQLDDLSLIPGIQVKGGQNRFHKAGLWHVHTSMHTLHTRTLAGTHTALWHIPTMAVLRKEGKAGWGPVWAALFGYLYTATDALTVC